MSITRVFRPRADVLDPSGANEGTMLQDSPMLDGGSIAARPYDAENLFSARWSILRRGLTTHRRLGVLVCAFDESPVAVGQAWIAATLDRTRALIVGRHSMCGLPLPRAHAHIALRHVALLVRAISYSEVQLRVLDLRTQSGFGDESGRVLQAITTEGSCFLSIGGVKLALLVTRDDGEVPERARDAYACIPPRVFMQERAGTAGAPRPRAGALRPVDGETWIRSQLGPAAASGELAAEDDRPVGALTARSDGGHVRRVVGASYLDRGILVGRYSRCDVGLAADSSRLSRVHLLLVRDHGEVLAVDTASLNGTTCGEKALAARALEDGSTLELGGELHLSWNEA